MPHKHVRRGRDASVFDLPPSVIAKPLPVQPHQRTGKSATELGPKSRTKKRPRSGDDDAPRAFKRLMAFAGGRRLQPGLDGGGPEAPRSKDGDAEGPEVPTIRPGEKLGDFSARVDAALPVGGLTARGKKDPVGLKVYTTKKEKKMHKMYDQWREEDQKIKERREEELEQVAERELDEGIAGVSAGLVLMGGEPGGKKRSKRAKRRGLAVDDDDPWEEVKRRRAEGRVGLHDVALCPPELHKMPSQKRLAVDGASVDVGNVPKSAGSLRRREELNRVGTGVVAAYRQLREKRRGAGSSTSFVVGE